jgi:SAM-dependent methyltransferase
MLDSSCATEELRAPPADSQTTCPALVRNADRADPDALPHFDRLAAIYRLMEYLSFGPLLERCRFAVIPELTSARRALVLGDGDGRFLARLFSASPQLRVHAIDGSPAMLRQLRARIRRREAASRLTTACADIRSETCPFTAPGGMHSEGYDLIASHFFLDCLTPGETDALAARLRPHLAPGALWVISEFEVPSAAPLRAVICRLTIAGLYAAFHLLTGLRVRRIPPWRDSLARAGFTRRSSRSWLGGLLVAELWQLE